MSGSWVLDVYAALACLEYPEPRVLETDAQRQAWVRRVNKLKFPIELICSEDSVRGYQDRSKTIACVVRFRSVPWCLLCRGDPQDPVCLPCKHIFCAACIQKCLVPCQMYVCPHCKQAVDDFTPAVPSEDLRRQ
ncbi:E3 ubiquitin-protein ligase rnf213-alpha-like isoform X7 [Vanacampus margaritifer]